MKILRILATPFRWITKILSFFRHLLSNLIFFAILAIIFFAFTEGQKSPEIAPGTILKINIEGDLVEEASLEQYYGSILDAYLGQGAKQETVVYDVIDALKAAEADDNIGLVVLDTKHMGTASIVHLETIGKALNSFKKTGKKVVSLQDNYSQGQYYLASYSSEIALNPEGIVGVTGLAMYKLYFKDLLDTLKVDYNVFVVGNFKSALETFTRSSMSDADKTQSQELLDSLWDSMVAGIIKQRNLAPDALYNYTHKAPELLKNAGGSSAQMALEAGLVDHLFTRAQMREFLEELSGGQTEAINIDAYLASLVETTPENAQGTIALLIAEGNIVPGKQAEGAIAADSMAYAIRNAAKDPEIKGLVLRINSGGGSAFASEIIRQELLQFQKTEKPFYVSMGRVAASGAYWLSADANRIFAHATTITGSIGIFGAVPTLQDTLATIGVYNDGVATSPLAGATNLTRAMTEPARNLMQQSIDRGYSEFLSIVSTGRNIDMAQVKRIAEGRIYSGIHAKELGLVDEIGNLQDTIDAMAMTLQLDEYRLQNLDKGDDVRTMLRHMLTDSAFISLVKGIFGEGLIEVLVTEKDKIDFLSTSPDPAHIYAHGGFISVNSL